MALSIKSYIQNFLFNLSKSSPVFYYLSKKIYDLVFYFFYWYISKSKDIESIIPSGSYRTNVFTPWQSDIDILILTHSRDDVDVTSTQKRLYKKIKLFSSVFQLIKHVLIIPKNIYYSDIFSLIPPFILSNNEKTSRGLQRIHSIVCTEEYLNRIYFFLTSKNQKYLSSAKEFLNRKRNFISAESIRLLRLLGQIKTDLEIIRNDYEKNLLKKVLVNLQGHITTEAFFMVYHHAYLTTRIWTAFRLTNPSIFNTKTKTPVDNPPFIKNFLDFAAYRYLPYLKNIIHTKFICKFYNLQPHLLNYISVNNQIIPSLLDEIFIIHNYSRATLETLNFPYGVNFDRNFNDINSYEIEHYRGILFALLNFELYLKDSKYFLTPYSVVTEKKYITYKKFLDKKIDLKELINTIYKKKYDLLNKLASFLRGSRYQQIIEQINSL